MEENRKDLTFPPDENPISIELKLSYLDQEGVREPTGRNRKGEIEDVLIGVNLILHAGTFITPELSTKLTNYLNRYYSTHSKYQNIKVHVIFDEQ